MRFIFLTNTAKSFREVAAVSKKSSLPVFHFGFSPGLNGILKPFGISLPGSANSSKACACAATFATFCNLAFTMILPNVIVFAPVPLGFPIDV